MIFAAGSETLRKLGVECRKVLCGKENYFKHSQGKIFRSLMITGRFKKHEDSFITTTWIRGGADNGIWFVRAT
ncbi:MAG: hypothetical protein R3E08_08230 [Thiotrichaceae bacterium]